MIMDIKAALTHNLTYVVESLFGWSLVATGHVVGLTIEQPFIQEILPWVQLVVYLLAGATSLFTLYKIRKDIRSEDKNKPK